MAVCRSSGVGSTVLNNVAGSAGLLGSRRVASRRALVACEASVAVKLFATCRMRRARLLHIPYTLFTKCTDGWLARSIFKNNKQYTKITKHPTPRVTTDRAPAMQYTMTSHVAMPLLYILTQSCVRVPVNWRSLYAATMIFLRVAQRHFATNPPILSKPSWSVAEVLRKSSGMSISLGRGSGKWTPGLIVDYTQL
jgi:hypothetical protein